MGVDNASIEIDGPEVRSWTAARYVAAIDQAGILNNRHRAASFRC
jgi:UDP-3-O-acyl-N-acetylglucosamine deacetylase